MKLQATYANGESHEVTGYDDYAKRHRKQLGTVIFELKTASGSSFAVMEVDEIFKTEEEFEELFERIANIELFPYQETAYSKYCRGDCDVFAVALEELLTEEFGEIWAVHEPAEEEDEPDMLVHAGFRVEDDIIDANGKTTVDAWLSRWGEQTSHPDWDFSPIEREGLEEMQGTKMEENEIELAKSIAGVILRGLGYSTEPTIQSNATP